MKSMCNIIPTVIYMLLFLFLYGCDLDRKSTDQNEVIASVDGVKITREEFLKRVEFYPPPRFTSVNGLNGNAALLELLIGEKIMAKAARKAKLDTIASFREQIKFVELKAVLEELFKQEIKEKIQIERTEIMDAFQKSHKTLIIQMFQTRRRQFADEFQHKLRSGLTFEQVMNGFYGEDFKPEKYTQKVSWSDLEEALEERVFEMKTGETSSVIKFSKGYAIIKVDNIFVNPLVLEGKFRQRESGIRKTLRARRMRRLNAQFVAEFMNRQNVVVRGEVFETLASWLDKIIRYNGESEFSQISPAGLEVDFDNLKLAMEHKLDIPLLTFNSGHLTLRESLRKLHIYRIQVNQESPQMMRRQIHADLKKIMQDELLGREAYRRGLQKRASVRAEVQLWSDYYLSRMFAKAANLQPQKNGDIVFPDTLKTLYETMNIQIVQTILDSIKLTSILMVTVRPGYGQSLVVPPWPNF